MATPRPPLPTRNSNNHRSSFLRLPFKSRTPLPDPSAAPVATLVVKVLAARDLVSKDRNGLSDPFLSIVLERQRVVTPTCFKTLNPVWGVGGGAGEAKLEKVVYDNELLASQRVEVVVWDKDRLGKEYMGEVSIQLSDLWSRDEASTGNYTAPLGFYDPANLPVWYPIQSSRAKSHVSGSILIHIGFIPLPSADQSTLPSTPLTSEQLDNLHRVLRRGNKDSSDRRGSIMSTLPTEGLGTVEIQDRPHIDVDSDSSSSASVSEGESDEGEGEQEGGLEEELESETETEEEGSVSGDEGYFDSHTRFEPTTEEGHVHDEQDRTVQPEHLAVDPNEFTQSPALDEPLVPAVVVPATHSPPLPTTLKTPISSPTLALSSSSRRALSLPKFIKRAGSSIARSKASGGDSSKAESDVTASASEAPVTPAVAQPKRRRFSRRKRTTDESEVVESERDGAITDPVKPPRRRRFRSAAASASAAAEAESANSTPATKTKAKRGFARRGLGRRKTKTDYNLAALDSSYGLVQIEIKSAANLPRWKNALHTSFDMDPFVVASIGTKVFRTRIIRHSLNPIWDEKLFFSVKESEEKFLINFSVCDWDVATANDHVGYANLTLKDLLEQGVKPDKEGFYATAKDGTLVGDDFVEQRLKLVVEGKAIEEGKEGPTLLIRTKFTPYAALRQQFWRFFLRQYDIDESGSYSLLELQSCLDSLGSTLSSDTIAEFFDRFGKTIDEELTLDEAVSCLEHELRKPIEQKRPIAEVPDSGLATPALPSYPGTPSHFTFTGLPSSEREIASLAKDLETNQFFVLPVGEEHEVVNEVTPSPPRIGAPLDGHATVSRDEPIEEDETTIERLINIKACPLCQKPRMTSRAEVDIITHIAICASNDPRSVNRIVVGSFVTTSNAQRKWITKAIAKVTKGAYSLGANSANIIVQDRSNGVLLEEKMAVYVRLGMRLAYKGFGAGGTMEGPRIRKLLESMSIKQGIKFDSPNSVNEIKPFIAFHNLDLAEVLEPLSSFKTFNQFFYRKLKPDARPVADPEDPNTLVSPADCRAMFFPTIKQATTCWIKGQKFSLARLLGPEFEDKVKVYEGGSMCIFRLAPQDYHRFHSPVDGVLGKYSKIGAQYYTVNPQGVRSAIDIFGENVRVVQPIVSPAFGETMHIWVGAMMVGSIVMTVAEGDEVKRGQEVGYFAFGGSTIICLFPPGVVTFDADLLENSKHSMETLVKMGTRVGRRTGH